MRRWWPPARRGAWPIPLTTTGRLTQDVGDRPLALFHQLHRPPQGVELHLLVVEPELPQDRRVQVAVVMAILDGLVTHLVGRAVDDAALHAAAGQPDGVAARVVVAAGRVLRPGAAAELA